MPALEQAKDAMLELARITGDPTKAPDPASVLALKGRLIGLYAELGEEKNRRFSAKEQSYLRRKLAQSTQFRIHRFDHEGKTRKAAADADHDAILAVGEEFKAEIEAATELDRYLTFLRSVEMAVQHAQQVVAFYRKSDSL